MPEPTNVPEALAIAGAVSDAMFAENVLILASKGDMMDHVMNFGSSKEQYDSALKRIESIKEYFEGFKQTLEINGISSFKENSVVEKSDELIQKAKVLSEKNGKIAFMLSGVTSEVEETSALALDLDLESTSFIEVIHNVLSE